MPTKGTKEHEVEEAKMDPRSPAAKALMFARDGAVERCRDLRTPQQEAFRSRQNAEKALAQAIAEYDRRSNTVADCLAEIHSIEQAYQALTGMTMRRPDHSY